MFREIKAAADAQTTNKISRVNKEKRDKIYDPEEPTKTKRTSVKFCAKIGLGRRFCAQSDVDATLGAL
jgi:O-succinylbenzoate synthase